MKMDVGMRQRPLGYIVGCKVLLMMNQSLINANFYDFVVVEESSLLNYKEIMLHTEILIFDY